MMYNKDVYIYIIIYICNMYIICICKDYVSGIFQILVCLNNQQNTIKIVTEFGM